MNMQRRQFGQFAAGAALLSSTALVSGVHAQPKKPQAGTEYQVLDPRATVDAPAGKIEVVEFFWYNCPHCNAFEPALESWIKKLPKDVVVRRVPVAFQDSFVPQQRLYYALEAMGLVEKLHVKVFTAIHGEKIRLEKGDVIADWVETSPNFWSSTTHLRWQPKPPGPRNCKIPTKSKVYRLWAWLGGFIPTAPWRAAWNVRCRWSMP